MNLKFLTKSKEKAQVPEDNPPPTQFHQTTFDIFDKISRGGFNTNNSAPVNPNKRALFSWEKSNDSEQEQANPNIQGNNRGKGYRIDNRFMFHLPEDLYQYARNNGQVLCKKQEDVNFVSLNQDQEPDLSHSTITKSSATTTEHTTTSSKPSVQFSTFITTIDNENAIQPRASPKSSTNKNMIPLTPDTLDYLARYRQSEEYKELRHSRKYMKYIQTFFNCTPEDDTHDEEIHAYLEEEDRYNREYDSQSDDFID